MSNEEITLNTNLNSVTWTSSNTTGEPPAYYTTYPTWFPKTLENYHSLSTTWIQENKTEKAFILVRHLLEKKIVNLVTIKDFVDLVVEITNLI
jgi:predicted transcriptional regulator